MKLDEQEEKLPRSVALQNAQAVLLARERAERALLDSNERITNTLESIGDAFVVLDRDWRFTYVNPQAEHMGGGRTCRFRQVPIAQTKRSVFLGNCAPGNCNLIGRKNVSFAPR